jgi:hypothetical protein
MEECSGSWREDECGSREHRSRHGMNWKELLRTGPGEAPGRDEAIVRARARSAEKRVTKGRKRR